MQMFDENGKLYDVAEGTKAVTFEQKCTRCGGAGGYQFWPDFTCFRCGGNGRDPSPLTIKLYTAEGLAKLKTRREKAQAKRQAKAEAERLQLEAKRLEREQALEADPLFVQAKASDNPFIVSLVDSALNGKDWTETQRAKLDEILNRKEEYLGTVGEALEFEGEVTFERIIQSAFGYTQILNIRTNTGLVVWFNSSRNTFAKGDKVAGKATVKEHKPYNGTPQTVVTRAKLNRV